MILIEYSKNYSKITDSFWNYCRDQENSGEGRNINYSITKSLDYKTKITGRLEGDNTEKENVQIVAQLKHLSIFWRTLVIPLVNCEINLIWTCSENCVITSKSTKDADHDADPAVAAVNNPTAGKYKITETKLYLAVVTLSAKDDNKLLE